MKRNIVINSNRTALVISDSISAAVEMVHKDSNVGDEIFVFDTDLHIAYSYKVVRNGFELIEKEVPVQKFRNFGTIGDSHQIYMSLIGSFIK